MEPPDRYPALPPQRGMILGTMNRPDSGTDIQQVTIDWGEPLDRDAFSRTWRAVTARHPALRTSFRLDAEDGLLQVVEPAAEPDLRWPGVPPDTFLSADRFEPFDVGQAPLFRVSVLGGSRSVLTFHHAIMDGRSLRLLLDEVFTEYSARRAGRPPPHRPRPPFADFVRWWLAAGLDAAEAFWRGYLAGAQVPRSLPGSLAGQDGKTAEPATDETVLTGDESSRLRALAAAAGTGPAAAVNTAWALLRGAYAGASDVTFGVTRSARYGSVPGADDIIGMLITTVPLRVRLDPAWTVRELIADVAGRTRAIREHQLAPLASILGWAGLPAEPAPLDSLVIFERERPHTALARIGPEPARASVRIRRLPSFPLTLYAFDEPRMCLAAMWDGRRVLSASARLMLARLRDTLRQMADRPDARLSELDLGAEAEAGLRATWNATRRPYPRESTVPSLFAAQAAARPGAPALAAGGATVSYAELDRETDRLARLLAGQGAGPGTLVAVALPRGASLIRALLAVLKAGCAYLPLDLTAPPARTAAVLTAAGARLALTDAVTGARLALAGAVAAAQAPGDAPVRVLDLAHLTGLAARPAPPAPPARIHPLHLAYVGYTSGSTGVPKGVAVPHRAVVRLVSDPGFARLGPGERVLHLAPAAFDASTFEIWGALCTGATLVIAPPDPLDPADLAALLRDGAVTVAWLTAGLFHQLADADPAALAAVGQLLTGGDVVSPAAVRTALAVRGGRPVVNGYGPTENTTFTTCHVMTEPDGVGERVPIGRPVPQTAVHVLDASLRPVPAGVTGELYAGGDGLARGYHADAAATASSFLPGPDGARLYRTGDLARWRADGVLEFLGRRDEQVKIRGFRVEPAEIEAVLAAHPGVGAAAVTVRGSDTGRHLAAYVTPAGRAAPTPSALREHVVARLPAYLVPATYTVLSRLPLTVHGKVDRAALPAPGAGAAGGSTHMAGPATPTERRLAGLWSELLPAGGLPDGVVARDVSFFTLGGNSLTAARLVRRTRDAFGAELGLGAFYDAPTLAAMAAEIDAAQAVPAVGRGAQPALRRHGREAHRVADRPARPGHLVELTEGWALWRTVGLRGAGFPFGLLSALADEELARAADAANAVGQGRHAAAVTEAAYQAEFARGARRLGRALWRASGDPAFREAVTWQNPHALATGVDVLRRRDPEQAARNAKHREHELLVASYLQRYCAKNDTIGFFGPVGWARFGQGDRVRIEPAPGNALVSDRRTHLEGWAVTAVMAPHTAALRPWLVPRRMPFTDVCGRILRVPLAPPVPLSAAEAAVLRACDGIRDAREVAAVALADPDGGLDRTDQVYAVLDAAALAHRIAWRVEVPPQDTRPEQAMRARLARVTDEPLRAAATAALDELAAARDALAAAAGQPGEVAAAMTALASTFSRLSGAAPARRAGALYAGRTPVYEDCTRAGAVEIGEAGLDRVRGPLGLVLDSARWFTAAGAALYRRLFTEVHRRRAAELGSDVVPFADFWVRIAEILANPPPRLTAPLTGALQRRWAEVLSLSPGQPGPVRRTAAELAAGVAAAFPASPPGWPSAVHHSPDLMIARADGSEWVLGELHPGLNTLRYALWSAAHPSPGELRAAMASDLRRGVVYAAETGEEGGGTARQANVLASARDLWFVFAHDSTGHEAAQSLPAGECDLLPSPAGLRVRHRHGRADLDVIDVLGDLIAAALSQHFRLLAPAAHAPRVSIDGLVASRESWTFPAGKLTFATAAGEARRYREARAWAARTGLPRHTFLRSAGERKPVYADLTSMASVSLMARSVRRARRHGGDAAPVTVTEMLPCPEQLWLTDAEGRRYTAELRVVAVDLAAG